MDLTLLKRQISSAVQEIHKLILRTEDIYGAVHLQLPTIEKHIELTVKEMLILLEYFIPAEDTHVRDNRLDVAQNDMLKLSRILHRIGESFSSAAESLVNEEAIRKTTDLFLAGEQGEEDSVAGLLDMIAQIRDKLTDIEIISLNAIIYAARLGEAGRAFGVVSDSINNLSNQLNEEYTHVRRSAQQLEVWNSTFKSNLKSLLEYHHRLASEQQEEFRNLFRFTVDALQEISLLLRDLIGNVEKAVRPVQSLMAAIQTQDILRQQMENLIKCLNSLTDNIENHHQANGQETDPNQHLNFLQFATRVLELAVRLVDNIEHGLMASLAELDADIEDIRTELKQLIEDGDVLTEFLAGTEGDRVDNAQHSTVKTLFLELQSFMQKFAAGLGQLEQEIAGFTDANQVFYQQMSDIEGRIGVIKRRISFLQKLQLMTRIELARLQLKDGSFGRELSGISERIIESVNAHDAYISALKAQLEGELQRFEQVLHTNQENIGHIQQLSVVSLEELNSMELLVSRAVQTLGQNLLADDCGSMVGAIESIAAHLERGAQLPLVLGGIKVSLAGLQETVAHRKQEALQAAGLSDWESTSRELQAVLDNFTTSLERLTASQVFANVEVDVGDEAGNLTLF